MGQPPLRALSGTSASMHANRWTARSRAPRENPVHCGFAMGIGLEKLARTGGHQELGFVSVEAYAAERCGWSATWTRQARRITRRCGEWPALKEGADFG